MTGQPPSSDSDRRDPLGFDEILALLVAFATVGAILWWGFGRKAESWLSQQWTPKATVEGTQPSPGVTSDSQLETSPSQSAHLAPEGSVESQTSVTVTEPETAAVPGSMASGVAPGIVAPAIVAAAANRANSQATPQATPASPSAIPSPIVVPSATPEAAITFADVPNDYWAYPFIAELSRRGIISGFAGNRFQPDQPVTRAQYASLLSKVLTEVQREPIQFGDVPANFWGTQAIDEAVKSGFLKGHPDQTFQPNQPISRLQVLLSLANGFNLPKPADSDSAIQAFDDRDQLPEWAKPAVAAATNADVVVNYPNISMLNPDQPATRAEVAAMLYQALTTTGQVQPIQSNYIVRP